jgi:4-hydroxy-3-methylbut-2-enyl diphosphate reductase
VILVVGSPNSSNSNRLREIAEKLGCQSHLIDDASQVRREWIDNAQCVGITAGASAPEVLVSEVIAKLKDWGAKTAVEFKGIEEKVVFSLPKELRKSA